MFLLDSLLLQVNCKGNCKNSSARLSLHKWLKPGKNFAGPLLALKV
jgi:hypothetical protein